MKQIFWFVFLALAFDLRANETALQKSMMNSLDFIEESFSTLYAPAQWKHDHFGWSLQAEVEKAKEKVLSNPQMDVKSFHKVVNELVLSPKDYHVSASFYSTEMATLPLLIRSAEGRFFIAYINRNELSEESFPFNVGDEVVAFDGKNVEVLIQQIILDQGQGTPETDRSLAEMTLTKRRGRLSMSVPQGPVTLSIKAKDQELVVDHQLIWNYEPEKFGYDSINANIKPKNVSSKKEKVNLKKYSFLNPIAKTWMTNANNENLWTIGGKKSFIPELGTKIWEASEDNQFYAYIFKNEEGKLIGYVRIASYSVEDEMKAVSDFAKVISHMEKVTDSLVIDQINNPGGSVFYLYTLVSMLTNTAIATPKHHMAITQTDVAEALKYLPEIEALKTDEDVKKWIGEDAASGFPMNMSFIRFVRSFYQFILNEWNAGRRLTNPYFIWGVDKINPSQVTQYTKPILLLVNELDFSGGDFFPAILQDAKRVKILGTRTAGAGGYVLSQTFPNYLGIEDFSITGSLAKRVNNSPIENLGVTPDIQYQLTVKDFEDNFSQYTEKILESIE